MTVIVILNNLSDALFTMHEVFGYYVHQRYVSTRYVDDLLDDPKRSLCVRDVLDCSFTTATSTTPIGAALATQLTTYSAAWHTTGWHAN